MNTKLTLSIDNSVIEKAKAYAKSTNRSLSDIVESYLKSISGDGFVSDVEISPYIKSISSGINIPDDFDEKDEYRKHLAKKYK